MKFSDWEFKTSNFLSAGDYQHAEDILEWIAQEPEDVAEDKFDRIAVQRGWAGQARDHTRLSRYLFTVLSNRTDGTPHPSVRNGRQSRSERMETAAHGGRTSDQCDGARIHEEVHRNSKDEDDIRREQRDPDAGRTGAEVRRVQRQEIR